MAHYRAVNRRIQRRNHRIGQGENCDPEAIEELQKRHEQHERLTRGKPARAFSQILKDRRDRDKPEEEEEEAAPRKGAIDPHMGLQLGQDSALTNGGGARSGKVIVKG